VLDNDKSTFHVARGIFSLTSNLDLMMNLVNYHAVKVFLFLN
jgi:hypothetical protein